MEIIRSWWLLQNPDWNKTWSFSFPIIREQKVKLSTLIVRLALINLQLSRFSTTQTLQGILFFRFTSRLIFALQSKQIPGANPVFIFLIKV